MQRYLRRMHDEIDEDDLEILVISRQILQEANEDTRFWTIIGEDKNTIIRLEDLHDQDDL